MSFDVSYQRVNEREAMHGGTSRHGFVAQGLTLREAVEAVRRETPSASETRGTWPDCSDVRHARNVSTEVECWEDGDSLTLAVHFPSNATPSSRARLARVLCGEAP